MTHTDADDQRARDNAYDHGVVAKYFPERGYGFIAPDFAEPHVYFHKNNVHSNPALTVGERVTFQTVVIDDRRKAKRINREQAP